MLIQWSLSKSDEKMAALRSEWEKARGKLVAREEDLSSQLEVFTATRGGTSQWIQVSLSTDMR